MVRGEAQGLQLDLGVWSSGQKPGLVWIGMWGSSEDRGWVEMYVRMNCWAAVQRKRECQVSQTRGRSLEERLYLGRWGVSGKKKKKGKEQAQLRRDVGDFLRRRRRSKREWCHGRSKAGKANISEGSKQSAASEAARECERRAWKPPRGLSWPERECGGAWSPSVERLGLKAKMDQEIKG